MSSDAISFVRVHVAPMAVSWLNDSLIASPMSRYPEHRAQRRTWFGNMSAAVVEIGTASGASGLGFAGGGRGTVAREIVDTHFAALLIGKNPFQTELIWDQLYLASTMGQFLY